MFRGVGPERNQYNALGAHVKTNLPGGCNGLCRLRRALRRDSRGALLAGWWSSAGWRSLALATSVLRTDRTTFYRSDGESTAGEAGNGACRRPPRR